MKTPGRLFIASLAILTLAQAEAQEVHIKARFIELPGPAAADLCLGSFDTASIPAPDDIPQPTSVYAAGEATPQPARDTIIQPKFMAWTTRPTSFTGVMTESQFLAALRVLKSNPDREMLTEPEVTTLSGRQTEMRATQIVTVITNFAYRETSTTVAVFPQANAVETGPILDTIPTVLPDGYTIDLKTRASLTKFLGYDKTTNTITAFTSTGARVSVPTILPSLCVRKASAHVKLWDGQTVVLGGLKNSFYDGGKEVSAEPDYFVKAKTARGQPEEQDKEVLVLITVTLVDPADKRIHSDEEMPFAKNGIPPQ